MLAPAADIYTCPTAVVIEDDTESFEVIIDEPLLCVVRRNGFVAAQVHSPVDLAELSYRLAEEGFMATEMMAYEDGVLELLLRDLSDTTHMPEGEAKLMNDAAAYMKERESIYA